MFSSHEVYWSLKSEMPFLSLTCEHAHTQRDWPYSSLVSAVKYVHPLPPASALSAPHPSASPRTKALQGWLWVLSISPHRPRNTLWKNMAVWRKVQDIGGFRLFILLDILYKPSRGYMNVVQISKLIKFLCHGIRDLTPQSPFRKISLGINICLNVLRRNNSMQKLKLHQFKLISIDSD